MITVEIDFHCMCLVVPDPDKGAVHVLLPCTHHEAGARHHVAVMYFIGADGTRKARRLEGWALDLGDKKAGNARTTLTPATGAANGSIVELTARGGKHLHVERAQVEGNDDSVISRISFYGGEVTAVAGQEPRWIFGGNPTSIANRVTWRIAIPPEQMVWNELHPAGGLRSDARRLPPPPPEEIKPLRFHSGEILKLQVYHVTPTALPGGAITNKLPTFDGSVLTPEEVVDHFQMFYALVGVLDPQQETLPELPPPAPTQNVLDPPGGSPGWACLLACASVA